MGRISDVEEWDQFIEVVVMVMVGIPQKNSPKKYLTHWGLMLIKDVFTFCIIFWDFDQRKKTKFTME